MEYIKLNDLTIQFDVFQIENVINNTESFKYYSPKNDNDGLFYYKAPEDIVNIVKAALPIELQDSPVDLCKIYKGALPHKDHDCLCKLNFYLKSGDAKTIFFEDPVAGGYSYHGDSRSNMFDIRKDRLKRTTMFVANDGDTYLLNTSKIHAVTMENENTRIIVSVSFNRSFEEVSQYFLNGQQKI